jgi:hypothetical protein
MYRALTLSFVVPLALLVGEGGCAPAADHTDSAEAELISGGMDGDRVVAEAAAVLGADRKASVRYALDRAFAKVGGYNVEAAPSVMCGGGPEHVWWNGEDAALSRLGMVGLANIVALEAVTSTSTHVALLSNAPGSNADAAKALAILRDTESPGLVLSALSALAANSFVSESAVRALLALEMDVNETKRVRADDGSLRLPDFSNPPSASALLERLRRSSASPYRAFAARIWSRWAGGTTAADVDTLLSDRDYTVRVAAAPLFWMGSQPSTANAKAFIDWFSGPEAHQQLRAALLRTSYGLSVDQATAWADEPAGFRELLETTRAEVVGGMLGGANPKADIRSLLTVAASFEQVSDIVDDAARAVNASTVLSDAEKKSAVIALLPAAESRYWRNSLETTPLANLWRILGKGIMSSPATPEVVAAFQRAVFLPDNVDKAALDGATVLLRRFLCG